MSWHLFAGSPVDFDLKNIKAPTGGNSSREFESIYVVCGNEMDEGWGGYSTDKKQ